MEFCNDHHIERNKPISRSIVQVGNEQIEINHNSNHVTNFHTNNAKMART